MKHFRIFGIITAICICLLVFNLSISIGQDVSVTPAAENASEIVPAEPLEIKLSVNEVRLDVVVLDRRGNPITDLTVADFEVYQDGKQQEILAGVYIDSQSDIAAQPAFIGNMEALLVRL